MENLNQKIFKGSEAMLGHDSARRELAAIMDQGRMHPVVLLESRAGMGKRHLAWWLAARWVCRSNGVRDISPCGVCVHCKEVYSGIHPDVFVIDHRGETIKTSEIEAMQNHLAMLSGDGIRVALIMDADQMNLEACNRALKTLEEPGDQVRVILTTSRPLAMPATVLGRCLRWRLPRLPRDLVLEWMRSQLAARGRGVEKEPGHLESWASRLGWSPGQFLRELSDDDDHESGLRGDVRALLRASRPAEVVKLAADLARVRKATVPEFLRVLEWELSRLYSGLVAGDTRAEARPETGEIRRERRRLISEVRKISVMGKVVLNTQLVAESIGLARWSGVEL